MLYLLTGTWILYWGLLAILPFESTQQALLEAFLLQLLFVVIVFVSCLAIQWSFVRGNGTTKSRCLSMKHAKRLAEVALLLSVVGLVANGYDKIFVQEVDYSQGVAVAREVSKAENANRTGVSSVFSVVGYLLSPLYFVTAVLLVLNWADFKISKRILLVSGVLLVAIAGSALIGGRTSLLLLCSYCIAAIAFKQPHWRIKTRFKRSAVANAILGGVAATSVATYMIFIFSERAKMTGVTLDHYVVDAMPLLNVQISPWFEGLSSDYPVLTFFYPIILSACYLLHSFSTCAAIISSHEISSTDAPILFGHLHGLASKIGVLNPAQTEWFLSGTFPSLPGALLHDYGLLGLLLAGLILGIVCGINEVLLARKKCSMWAISVYVVIGSIVILSPYIFAMDLLIGPFIVVAFIIVSIVSTVRLRFTNASK